MYEPYLLSHLQLVTAGNLCVVAHFSKKRNEGPSVQRSWGIWRFPRWVALYQLAHDLFPTANRICRDSMEVVGHTRCSFDALPSRERKHCVARPNSLPRGERYGGYDQTVIS